MSTFKDVIMNDVLPKTLPGETPKVGTIVGEIMKQPNTANQLPVKKA